MYMSASVIAITVTPGSAASSGNARRSDAIKLLSDVLFSTGIEGLRIKARVGQSLDLQAEPGVVVVLQRGRRDNARCAESDEIRASMRP
jgi:hypothetical protein